VLKAYKLDYLKNEDFNMLKQLGIRRQNIHQLHKAINGESDSESEDEKNPFKLFKNQEEVVNEIINTKLNQTKESSKHQSKLFDKYKGVDDVVLTRNPRIYTQLISAFKECKDTGFKPKSNIFEKLREINFNKFTKRPKKTHSKKLRRNSILADSLKFKSLKISAFKMGKTKGSKLKPKVKYDPIVIHPVTIDGSKQL